MALKITEADGKLILEGNINSVTTALLKDHIKIMKKIARSAKEKTTRRGFSRNRDNTLGYSI